MIEKKWCIDKLKCSYIVNMYRKEFSKLEITSWEELKTTKHKVSDKIIGKNVLEPRKKWMT